MKGDLPPLKTWQFWHACRKILGFKFLNSLYNRSDHQVYRWSADPDTTNYGERNPLDRLIRVLDGLEEIGRHDIALAAVRIVAKKIGCEVASSADSIEPDQLTIEAECLDDYPALTVFHKAIKDGATTEEIQHYWQEAKRELDETFQMAVRAFNA